MIGKFHEFFIIRRDINDTIETITKIEEKEKREEGPHQYNNCACCNHGNNTSGNLLLQSTKNVRRK